MLELVLDVSCACVCVFSYAWGVEVLVLVPLLQASVLVLVVGGPVMELALVSSVRVQVLPLLVQGMVVL